ncbi:MAG: NAD-dependent epimerase/dehydratase [Microgenomates group bacterium GW2011_GWF2_45_18]|nr:MAG: NAD-dependent epimerase/dehydratase [Microgenomates group bacterium GW2011_GWF1_44_10]KKU01522.1 MAG: NAD-dependent epimerase/dehydratase [Microgenomates group bacterium GW2011_GWF2_45_18]HAU99430.1 NAD-dependent epimerase [Candidatus Paceibacterota bacterium]HAX01564.1 NAD-dependent epimerase [Candidatus Paceibacterota bacterium]
MGQGVLVTGAFGQIGSELVSALQQKHGKEHVVALGHHNVDSSYDGIVEIGEISDKEKLESIIQKYDVGTIYHLVSILSARGEQDPQLTWNVNMDGLKFVLDLAVKYKIKVFWPSSIAAFGPTTPRDNTPQHTILEPTTMYGVTKASGELLCQYYRLKYGLDVRSVRYPGLISWKAEPGGGTTDYAVAIFYGAIQEGKYTCFVKEDTVLPMMYMDDAIRGTIQLMDAPAESLQVTTSYNLAAISFSAQELAQEIQKRMALEVSYVPDHRQKIADSWPQRIDDSVARSEWGWSHEFDLSKMVDVMLEKLHAKLQK